MAEVVIMPKLGFNMDEGELIAWHKKVGDKVSKGEVIFEINTDKTVMPIESTSDGTLLKVMLDEGETAEVFTPIAVIGEADEDPDVVLRDYNKDSATEAPEAEPASDDKTPKSTAAQDTALSADIKVLKFTPKAKKLIKDEKLDVSSLANIKGTGYQGGITAKDIKASPLARKVAEQKDIDLSTVKGSGSAGKIMKADVEAAAVAYEPTGELERNENMIIASVTPYKGVRKIIGDRLSGSMFTAPHLYFTDAVDTTELTAFRKKLNGNSDTKIAVSDLLAMAACKALKKYPEINSSLQDDNIITYESINIGIAVAGNNGLVVPVIKNMQNKPLSEVSAISRDLVARAKEGRLTPNEYAEGTFTISNLGMFGIGNFTAIINAPESAILAVSSVRKTPVVITDENGVDTIAIRPMMNIQLSVDHRLIDGLLASQFVEYIKELLENPLQILI